RFNLKDHTLALFRNDSDKPLENPVPVTLEPGKNYTLRFANYDDRLTVWVNNSLPFGEGVPYDVPKRQGPTKNDLERPARIGVKGAAVQVHHLRLLRNTYHTVSTERRSDIGLELPTLDEDSSDSPADRERKRKAIEEVHQILSDPKKWEPVFE